MSDNIRIADYFFVASIHVDINNLDDESPETMVLERFPKEEHEDVPFTKNLEFFCLPEGAKVEYREAERRKPYIFTFCFTQEDGAQSFGTTLVFYEKLLSNGKPCFNKYNQELYIPKALCILSKMPLFTCHSNFLKGLFHKAITSYDVDDDFSAIISNSSSRSSLYRRSSFNSQLRLSTLMTSGNLLDKTAIERDIRYYIDALPYYKPGYSVHIPLFGSELSITCPPPDCLPFCDVLCMQSLLNCLSIENIEIVVSALLLDEKVLLHSNNKYQLTLCSTALLMLLKPVHYSSNCIPLLPAQLIDYVDAPTPYLFGIFSNTFALHQFDAPIEALLVHLDYDKITYPTSKRFPCISLPFLDLFCLSPPLLCHIFSTISLVDTVIDTDRPNSNTATYCMFSITAGPGPLGLKLRSEGRQLEYCLPGESVELREVAYVDSTFSQTLHGSVGDYISQCMLLQQNPALLEVGGMSVVGLSLKRVTILLASAPRPLQLLFQVGVRGVPETMTEGGTVRLDTHVPSQVMQMQKYLEDVRIAVFIYFVLIFKDMNQCISIYYIISHHTTETTDGVVSLDKKRLLHSVDDVNRLFIDRFMKTQLFQGLWQAIEKKESGMTSSDVTESETISMLHLIDKCIDVLNEEGNDDEAVKRGILRIRTYLHPSNWKLKQVNLPVIDTDVLSDEMKEILLNRNPAEFPHLNEELLGEPMKRFQL